MKWKVERTVFRIIKGIVENKLDDEFEEDLETYLTRVICNYYVKYRDYSVTVFLFSSIKGNIFYLTTGLDKEIQLMVFNQGIVSLCL